MTYSIDEANVIYADLDPKEGVVLNLKTKNYYRLNETGQIVWQGLAAKRSIDAIANSISETYEISPEAARTDVERLFEELKNEALIEGPAQTIPAPDMEAARTSKKGR